MSSRSCWAPLAFGAGAVLGLVIGLAWKGAALAAARQTGDESLVISKLAWPVLLSVGMACAAASLAGRAASMLVFHTDAPRWIPDPDERLLKQGPANRQLGSRYYAGWLFLTDARLHYEPLEAGAWQAPEDWPLTRVWDSQLFEKMFVIETGLEVLLRGGNAERLSVPSEERHVWQREIDEARNRASFGVDTEALED